MSMRIGTVAVLAVVLSGHAAEAQNRKPREAAGTNAPARAVTCEGPFAKDSSHAKLVEAFGKDNVEFTSVDGPEGTKMMASVLFGKDPKAKLQVLWHDEEKRERISSVVIEGESGWTGPKGLRVGLPLADIEKRNGKPFKMSGFDWDLGGYAGNWQGGALSKMSGGCTLGMRFSPDDKAPKGPRGKVVGDKEFLSSDPNMRAVRPKVSEILIGYGE